MLEEYYRCIVGEYPRSVEVLWLRIPRVSYYTTSVTRVRMESLWCLTLGVEIAYTPTIIGITPTIDGVIATRDAVIPTLIRR